MKKLLTLAIILLVCSLFLLSACGAGETVPAAPPPPPADTPAADPPAAQPTPDAGATQAQEEPAPAPAGVPRIGFSIPQMDVPFFVSMWEGAEYARDHFGVYVHLVDARNDTAQQVSDIEALLALGIDVLVVCPVDSSAIVPKILDVMDMGIPVVAVNRRVTDVDVDVWTGTDNFLAAAEMTEHLISIMGEDRRVAILEGTPGASSGILRLDGFLSVAQNRMDIVASQTANFNRVDGMTVAENLLTANPDIEIFVAMNDEMALGAIEAAIAFGRQPGVDIWITGFDGSADAVAAVNEGTMLFTVQQQSFEMGIAGVEIALGLLRGETFDADIPVPAAIIE